MENLELTKTTRSVVDRMEHVHIGVKDIDRSIDFYRRAFGFEVRFDGSGRSGRCVHVGTDRFYIAMSAGNGPGETSFYHFAFSTPDMAEFRRRLEREGIEPCEQDSRKEGDAVYVLDPDGYEIEIVEYRKGYIYA